MRQISELSHAPERDRFVGLLTANVHPFVCQNFDSSFHTVRISTLVVCRLACPGMMGISGIWDTQSRTSEHRKLVAVGS